jgi:hypothetical protein
MLERRREPRVRVFLGGTITFNKRRSNLDCHIRNVSSGGAWIALEGAALVPDEFDFSIPCRERTSRARMIWRTADAAGIRFIDDTNPDVIPLHWARKLSACERENAALKRRVSDLDSDGQS